MTSRPLERSSAKRSAIPKTLWRTRTRLSQAPERTALLVILPCQQAGNGSDGNGAKTRRETGKQLDSFCVRGYFSAHRSLQLVVAHSLLFSCRVVHFCSDSEPCRTEQLHGGSGGGTQVRACVLAAACTSRLASASDTYVEVHAPTIVFNNGPTGSWQTANHRCHACRLPIEAARQPTIEARQALQRHAQQVQNQNQNQQRLAGRPAGAGTDLSHYGADAVQ